MITQKRNSPRKPEAPASNVRSTAKKKKNPKDPMDDSEAIERAVFDGMQDLRTEKTK